MNAPFPDVFIAFSAAVSSSAVIWLDSSGNNNDNNCRVSISRLAVTSEEAETTSGSREKDHSRSRTRQERKGSRDSQDTEILSGITID